MKKSLKIVFLSIGYYRKEICNHIREEYEKIVHGKIYFTKERWSKNKISYFLFVIRKLPRLFRRQPEKDEFTPFSTVRNIIAEYKNFDQQLEVLIKHIPKYVNSKGCSIYLKKEYVSCYSGKLIQEFINSETNKKRKVVYIQDFNINQKYLVLAATSRIGLNKSYVGKLFYLLGEGITGTVLKNEDGLHICDCRDESELQNFNLNKDMVDKYRIRNWPKPEEHALFDPIIALPIFFRGEVYGVLKIEERKIFEPYSEKEIEILNIYVRIIEILLKTEIESRNEIQENTDLIQNSIFMLRDEFIKSIKEVLKKRFPDYFVQIYLENPSLPNEIEYYSSNPAKDNGLKKQFNYGEGLIGWIYSTGKPIRCNSMNDLVYETELNDEQLIEISDGVDINEPDRAIECWHKSRIIDSKFKTKFLGVPIKNVSGVCIGVLCIHNLDGISDIKLDFSKQDIIYLQKISTIFTNFYNQERKRNIFTFFDTYDKNDKYDYYVSSLFEMIYQNFPNIDSCLLSLNKTGELELIYPKSLICSTEKIKYQTHSFCEISNSISNDTSLIFNYFEFGSQTQAKINQIMKRAENYPFDIFTQYSTNDGGIGLFQLRQKKTTTNDERMRIRDSALMKFTQKRLTTRFLMSEGRQFSKWKIKNKKIYSVAIVPIYFQNLSLGAFILWTEHPKRIISNEEITFFETISNLFSGIMKNENTIQKRMASMSALSHSINDDVNEISDYVQQIKSIYRKNASFIVEESKIENSHINYSVGKIPEEDKIDLALNYRINNLLNTAKRLRQLRTLIQGGEIEEKDCIKYDFEDSVTEALSIVSIRARAKKFKINYKNESSRNGQLLIYGPKDLIKEAIALVLQNALEYSRFSKKIELISNRKKMNDKNYVCLKVINLGLGFDELLIDKDNNIIPGRRGRIIKKINKKGHGDGLSIAHNTIVNQLGGFLKAKSAKFKIIRNRNIYRTEVEIYIPEI